MSCKVPPPEFFEALHVGCVRCGAKINYSCVIEVNGHRVARSRPHHDRRRLGLLIPKPTPAAQTPCCPERTHD